jgi:hypothetical protein
MAIALEIFLSWSVSITSTRLRAWACSILPIHLTIASSRAAVRDASKENLAEKSVRQKSKF